MDSVQEMIAPRTTRLTIFFVDQIQSTTPLSLGASGYVYITTSSDTLVPLHTSTYTVEFIDTIIVNSILMYIDTDNSINARNIVQISGDGGNTFVSATDEIPDGTGILTPGFGLWINNIDTGDNKLQIRILGRSTDGNLATIGINAYSYIDFILTKKTAT